MAGVPSCSIRAADSTAAELHGGSSMICWARFSSSASVAGSPTVGRDGSEAGPDPDPGPAAGPSEEPPVPGPEAIGVPALELALLLPPPDAADATSAIAITATRT